MDVESAHTEDKVVRPLLYLSRADIEGLGIAMSQVVEAVQGAFLIKAGGAAVMPPKTTLHGPLGRFLQVMPAWLRAASSLDDGEARPVAASVAAPGDGDAAGVKLVGVFPDNPRSSLPATSAIIVLADVEVGLPVAVMEGGLITALRTGAVVGVAARHLARPDVTCVGVVGCGAQARSSVRALATVLPGLRTVRCYDTSAAAAEAFAREVPGLVAAEPASQEGRVAADLTVEVCSSPADVCSGAGVVVSAITMSEGVAPPLQAGCLEPGALAVALDYDAAWSPEAMAQCERFITDDIEQTLATKAQGPRLREIPSTLHADLGDVVAGRVAGRLSPADRVFCLALGMAVEDVVCARLVEAKARQAGVGTVLPR